MINEISFINFKAYKDEKIELKPITLLLGPNNSGKSSILSMLRILSQTLQSYDQSVPLLLNGILGDFGTYKDVVFKNKKQDPIELCISTENLEKSKNKKKLDTQLDIIKIRMKFYYRSNIHELILSELEIYRNKKSIFFSQYSEKSEKHIIQSISGKAVPVEFKNIISEKYNLFHFLPQGIFSTLELKKGESKIKKFFTAQVRNLIINLFQYCRNVYLDLINIEYLGAMREPPERTYLFSGEKNRRVGPRGKFSSNILVMDSLRKGEKSKQIKEKVISWLKTSEIASDIKIKTLSDRHYELHLQNPKTKEYENYADVGYGNSQVIPVLVAGYNLSEYETLIVEEPEIHLHPKAQAELGTFFLELYKGNKYSIIETHSEYLVVRLQQYVAAGLINPKDIVLYYVYSTKEKKKIKKLSLDKQGASIDSWPEGFFPQRLDEAKKLAKIRFNQGEE